MAHGMRGWVALAALAVTTGCGGDDDKPGPTTKSDAGNQGWTASVGDDGTFVQTFDDEDWHVRKIANVDLHAVTCVGTEDGWAVGADGFVAYSPDGGASWQEQQSGTSRTLRAVHFVHDHSLPQARLVGLAAGDAGALAVTTNGGQSWKLSEVTTATLRGVTGVFNANLLLAVGDAGTVLRSTDVGESWQSSVLPEEPSISAVDADPIGRLVLAVDSTGGIWASSDAAKTFSLEHRANAPLRSVAVAPDGKRALAVGDSGTALARDDGGSWAAIELGTQNHLAAALITHDGERAYAAGEGGTLLSSADLRSGWNLQSIATKASLRGLEDLDPH